MERMPTFGPGKPKKPAKGKITMPVIRPGLPYQKDKNVNKLYKTY
jgi:hypothetical protein